MNERCDILISGGGLAGLSAALAFGQAGFSVICVDPAPPITTRDAEGADLRSTAFLQPARDFLDKIGLWDRLAPHATPLATMRIVDLAGEEPVTRDFRADDISDRPFGWNLPNWLLKRELSAAVADAPNVTFRPGTGTAGYVGRTAEARVRLTDGSAVTARLVIAADGHGSPMRKAAGIEVTALRHGQKALAFAVTHDAPHGDVSTEFHRAGGPFTLVPLPDYEGRPSSAVVWMERAGEADRLMALDEDAFNAEMTDRSGHHYGPLRLASRRTLWPIVSQQAHRLIAQRLALVAEAAHVMPPIGAQGLNTSLKDLAALLAEAEKAPEALGSPAMLAAYERARLPDHKLRMAGIAALDRMSMTGTAPLQHLRAAGLKLIHDVAPIRRGLMRLGLGA